MTGYKHSEETIKKIIENNKNRNDDIKNKISESMKFFYQSDNGKLLKEKLKELRENVIVSDETKKKLSELGIEKCKNLDINREKKKKYLGKDYEYWLDKIQQYKDKNLNFIIFYNFEEFKNFIAS